MSTVDVGPILVCSLAIFAIYPLLAPGLPNTADGVLHLYRTVELDRAWQDGVFYPRWAPDLAYGYGYPIFNFYSPLLYYLSQTLHLAGFSFEGALKAIQIGCLLLYGLGMYLFAKDILGTRSALLAAAAYIYVPFRFREVYIQGDYPQLLALAFVPLILWAFRRLVISGGYIWLVSGALSYGSLILSHNITAMLLSPLLIGYLVWLILLLRQRQRLVQAGLALALALSLTAFFWLPALYEQRWVQVEKLQSGFFDFRQYFVPFEELLAPSPPIDTAATNPYLPFNLGIVHVVLSLLSLSVLFKSKVRREEKIHILFFWLVLAVAVFMMTSLSTQFWKKIPFLAFTEFPWRFLGLAAVATSFLAGASLRLWDASRPFPAVWWVLALGLFSLIVTAMVFLFPWLITAKPNPSPADIVRFERESQALGTTSVGEYLSIWTKKRPYGSPLVAAYLDGEPISKLDLENIPSSVRVEKVEESTVVHRYRLTSSEPFTATLLTLYFPGWRVYVDDRPVPINVSYPYGLMEVTVPAGEHSLLLRFEDTPIRVIANSWTLAAVAIVVVFLPLAWPFRRMIKPSAPLVHKREKLLTASEAGLLLAAVVTAFLFKVGYIDPHTDWFRRHSPPDKVLGVQNPKRINLDDEVLFLGYDLAQGSVRQGESLRLTLYWKALHPLNADYSSFVHLDSPLDGTAQALSNNQQPGGIATFSWLPTLYTRDPHILSIPVDTPPGQYLLRAGLYDVYTDERLRVISEGGSEGSSSVSLQPLRVLRRKSVDLDSVTYRIDFRLGEGSIRLLGYDLTPLTVSPSGTIELTLYWQGVDKVEKSYTVFTHLLDEQGTIWGQKDNLPAQGLLPTTAWLPGEVIVDRYTIPVQKNAPVGLYRLAVGMYNPSTMERLSVVDGQGIAQDQDMITLSTSMPVEGEP
ncbi:MAG: 6-pyruvoyl-tetrahydropterin synthase-related protein [Anaerolineae bacterium]